MSIAGDTHLGVEVANVGSCVLLSIKELDLLRHSSETVVIVMVSDMRFPTLIQLHGCENSPLLFQLPWDSSAEFSHLVLNASML
jgi:hypothetical protein